MTHPSGPPKTVILAMSDPGLSERFAAALQEAGHRALTAPTLGELKTALGATPVTGDMVVLDLGLGEPGTDLVRAIRALRDQIPIVVLSGSVPDAALVRQLAALGIRSYINEHCPPHHILPSLAPSLFPDSFNRRTSARVKLDLPVAYRYGDTIATAPTLNLSQGGLGVRTMSPPAVGTKVHVRFRLPGSEQDIEADSRVAWSDHRAGMGLQFESVGTTDQSAVDEFVEHQA